MERDKRQIKAPQEYVIDKVCYPRMRKKKPKKKIPQRAQYKIIPAPLKYSCIASFYPLYTVNSVYFSFFLSFKDLI